MDNNSYTIVDHMVTVGTMKPERTLEEKQSWYCGFFIRMPLRVHPMLNPTFEDMKFAKECNEREFEAHINTAPSQIKKLFTPAEVFTRSGVVVKHPEEWRKPDNIWE